jgi:ribosomal protein L10
MSSDSKKYKTYEKIGKYLDQYRQAILCEIKDLPADMIHKIRKLLRGINTEVVCGKTVTLFFI